MVKQTQILYQKGYRKAYAKVSNPLVSASLDAWQVGLEDKFFVEQRVGNNELKLYAWSVDKWKTLEGMYGQAN